MTSIESSTAERCANRDTVASSGLLRGDVVARRPRCLRSRACCCIITALTLFGGGIILACIVTFSSSPHDDDPFGFPAGLEVLYVRHGQSTINKPLDRFNLLTDTYCQCSDCVLPEEVCNKTNPIARNANKRARWITKNRYQLWQSLIDAAHVFLEARETFDAPLTANGLLEARHLAEKTEELQRQWLAEQSGQTESKMVLVSSNLIRAVDTLLNGFAFLASSAVPVYLHTALQEYSLSGNGDVVSVFLPICLQRGRRGLSSRGWKQVSKLRLKGYTEASILDTPWAPNAEDLRDVTWWHQHNFTLVRVNHSESDSLVNHDYFLPNKDIGPEYHRQPPPDYVETVRLGQEYLKGQPLGAVRFNTFISWVTGMHASHVGLKRVVVVAHSTWFRDFVTYVQENGGLSHPSCQSFGGTRLQNTAMVKILNGRCSCLFNGTGLGGTCFQSSSAAAGGDPE